MLSRIFISLLDFYQKYGRPLLPVSCRFTPSCSEYLKQAITKYGASRGLAKGARRLFLCHPLSGKCGYDPLL